MVFDFNLWAVVIAFIVGAVASHYVYGIPSRARALAENELAMVKMQLNSLKDRLASMAPVATPVAPVAPVALPVMSAAPAAPAAPVAPAAPAA